ncbi:uncharacterized protein LOC124259864 [Haliotis rubra]|uniref:uncharacterized protein LOC124259864 n=1 Tax=Haliotis rubra TaxID=36100 RepID=UPI001EE609D2|nr:uncharacterized protein LOC124259864 [Haliotis rubra]
MNVKPQHKSFVYFEDGHVHSLEFSPVSDVCSHAIVRCKVIPSLPTSNKKECPDHIAWICLSKVTGKIHSADCTCAAGAGEACNHIAALCHCLVDVTTRRKAGTTSCTSQPCKWNNPRKRKLSPKRSQDVNFRKSSSVLHERKAVIENCSNSEKCDKIGNEKQITLNPLSTVRDLNRNLKVRIPMLPG